MPNPPAELNIGSDPDRGTNQDSLEIYEIGLTDEPAHRHAAYVQSLVHAPLAYAMERGLDEIVFGLDAEKPKTIRGAILTPVWAARPPSP